jgi:hypothetical protein
MAHHAAARARSSRAPIAPRRVSGPLRRVPTAPQPAAPRIPIDRLVRSRGWIWVIAIMLGGIVAMQVSLLRLNAGISRAVQTQATLEHQNAELQAQIAQRMSGERVRQAAAALSMVDPPAGEVRYLRARKTDARAAVRRMQPPSEQAKLVMANNGRLPDPVTPLGTTPSATAQATTTTAPSVTAAAAAADPTATAVPPAATAAPPTAPETATPGVAADPGTGAATAG